MVAAPTEIRPGAFVAALGERAAWLGVEDGVAEVWLWPFKVAREIRIGASPPLEVARRPHELELRFEGGIRARVFAAHDARCVLVVCEHDSPSAETIELSFVPLLRPQWPAGLGGEFARVEEESTLLVGEERGRSAAWFGGDDARLTSRPAERALPRSPVRFALTVPAGRTSTFAFAGAELEPAPLPESARLGRGQSATGTARADAVLDAARAVGRDALRRADAIMAANAARWSAFTDRTASLTTGDPHVDAAFDDAKIAIESAWVSIDRADGVTETQLVAGLAPSDHGPDGGESLRPGYGWWFDDDALVGARALNLVGDSVGAARVLRAAAARQSHDGKLMHEWTLAHRYCDWTGDFPYAYYKATATVDFTPALAQHVRASGDLGLARELLPTVERILDWGARCSVDGLLMLERAGIGAVEAGPLSDRLVAEVFLQGAWIATLRAAGELARALDLPALRHRTRTLSTPAEAAFEHFWDAHLDRYAFARVVDAGTATDTVRRPIVETSTTADASVYLALPLSLGVGEPLRAARTAAALNDPALATDWGLRMFAEGGQAYDPEHYNTGAVFAYTTGHAVLALYRHGLFGAGEQVLRSLYALSSFTSRGLVEEHLVGDRASVPVRPVPHQVFSSTTLIEGLLTGALGYASDALAEGGPTIALAPALPLPWPRILLRGLRVADRRFDLELTCERASAHRITATLEPRDGAAPVLNLTLRLPPWSSIHSAAASDGSTLEWTLEAGPHGTVECRIATGGARSVELAASLGPSWIVPTPALESGAPSRDPRLVRVEVTEREQTWIVGTPTPEGGRIEWSSDVALEATGAELEAGRREHRVVLRRTD